MIQHSYVSKCNNFDFDVIIELSFLCALYVLLNQVEIFKVEITYERLEPQQFILELLKHQLISRDGSPRWDSRSSPKRGLDIHLPAKV